MEPGYRGLRHGRPLIQYLLPFPGMDPGPGEHLFGECWPLFYSINIFIRTPCPRVIATTLLHEFIHLEGEMRDEDQVMYAQDKVDDWLYGISGIELLVAGWRVVK